MKEEFKRPQTLAICSKVINISRIAEKTKAQFAQQLKQNGIELEPERLQSVYDSIGGGRTDEELIAAIEAAEEKFNVNKKGE